MWQKQKASKPTMRSLKSSFLGRVFGLDANAPTSRALQRLKSFNNDQSGNVGMIFGGTLLVMVAGVGGAVDYGRWLNARSQTQYALDAATLAAGKVLRDGGTAAAAV
jgi:Flp pilus assembly protein TadG